MQLTSYKEKIITAINESFEYTVRHKEFNRCESLSFTINSEQKEVVIIITLFGESLFYADLIYKNLITNKYSYKGFSEQLKAKDIQEIIDFLEN